MRDVAVTGVQTCALPISDSAVLLAGLANYLSEDQKRALVLPAAGEGLLAVHRHFNGHQPPGVSDLEELSRRLTETLFAVGLPSDMLRKVDMMSMRASIEIRVPMLDEELVAQGLSLPHALKTDGRTGKLVLRELAARWLPRPVVAHPKHGFTVPLDVMVPEQPGRDLRDVEEPARPRHRGQQQIVQRHVCLLRVLAGEDGQPHRAATPVLTT